MFDRFIRARHVGPFTNEFHAIGDDFFGVFHENVILRSTGNHDIHFYAPGFFTGEELDAILISIILHPVTAGSPHFQHVLDLFAADAVRIIDIAVRTGKCDDLAAQLVDLRDNTPGNITETGNGHGFAFQRGPFGLQHGLTEVGDAETGRFRTGQTAAVRQAFAGQNAIFIAALDPFVLAEQIADFPAANAKVACRHVGVRPDMTIQLGHKALAEPHHFRIGLAARIKVGTSFAAADR